MIRPLLPTDTPLLLALAQETGAFGAADLQTLARRLEEHHDEVQAAGYRAATWAEDGVVAGFVCWGPAAMTEGTWYLHALVVGRSWSGRGMGTALLRHAEEETRRQQGRLLVVETPARAQRERLHRFFAKSGYAQEVVLRDFYAEGADLAIFRKRLGS